MSDIREVWKYWPLKNGWLSLNFAHILQGCHFVVGEPKNFKLLADISFEGSLQNTVLPSLMLFLCVCYEVTTSTARNFNNSWPLYLNFWNMINLSPIFWFIQNSKCQQFFFVEKTTAKKAQIFHIFKGLLFRNGWPYWHECWRALRDFCGLSKKCGFTIFPEI